MAGFPVPPAQTVNNPEDFGYCGWTDDPLHATNTATPGLGVVALVRFRAAKGGACGHLAFTVTAPGSVLTAGANFVGIFDTGQAAAATGSAAAATLLTTSADQTTNFGSAATPQAVLSTPPILVAGQDYFGAILPNGSTPPTLERMSSSGALALWNVGLSGLALRTGTALSGQSVLPASIPAASIAGGGASFAFVYLP